MNDVVGILAPFAITKRTKNLVLAHADSVLQEACACVTGGHIGLESLLCHHVSANFPNIKNIVVPPGQRARVNNELLKLSNITWMPLPGGKVTKEIWCREFEQFCDVIYIFLSTKQSNYPNCHGYFFTHLRKAKVIYL